MSSPIPAAAPTAMTGRSVAPDLARGLMLLLIAVANAPAFLWGGARGSFGNHTAEGSVADRVAQTVAIIGIDGRVYPMFAFLFGYGIVQLYRRQTVAGVPHTEARRLLRRRHWWMVAFGFVHAALLWYSDILGGYGLIGLILVRLFLDRADRTLRIWIGVLVALLALLAAGPALAAIAAEGPGRGVSVIDEWPLTANAEPDLLAAAWARIAAWAVYGLPTALFGLIIPVSVLLGMLAARHRLLDEPARHLPMLRRAAVVGLGIGWGSGLVVALQNVGGLGIDRGYDFAFVEAHSVGGLFGGVGYVALFGLAAAHVEANGRRREAGVPWAVQAVGKRSLSFYLFQSVVFAPLLCAWGFGLGQHLSSWSVALLAVATWLVSVALAVRLERAGEHGPAERLLRRLSYPRST
ncbi:hypothetical protein TPAU25S_01059 [Tsukamurella paurometabola]|uniref:DUF418 domain-containing protein n=1 Tax=Tsukamurella paurometabola (strain ATCC 8368 / DSM 20162 / CCUG 35730 / CIP 100753 / JCM 10117 / KCTC 9821 / NBRC 16120 / NCIMB 702349 / NCTC 13040) TaxID=521096 RepID=D5UXU8_TSUPD|nr:DUF418 domain-containing protein [Tsukamurella paurometabola]ADG80185.1 protein of unknown function DUF418 [Tsukamurella paurometabola DSM 20162]SUP38752.1 Predicted membrane protein [Tsukamurella paurometabola]